LFSCYCSVCPRTLNLNGTSLREGYNSPGVQVADLLTGAITSSHIRYLSPNAPINDGKLLTINRLSSMIGWDDLCYDTYPHPCLNIWHFPTEYRAMPKSLAPNPQDIIPYVNSEDISLL